MLTYFIFMNCDGDLDHPSHKDPVMLISMARIPNDMQVISATGLSIMINDKDGEHISMYPDPDRARDLREKIKDLLEEYLEDSRGETNIFDELKELDVNVDLKG
jgi:hypothetical protein